MTEQDKYLMDVWEDAWEELEKELERLGLIKEE